MPGPAQAPPDREKAFIEALADTGSVSRAAAMVNMSSEGAYYLRRQPGAEGFRRAWEAALDYGVARMKDIARRSRPLFNFSCS